MNPQNIQVKTFVGSTFHIILHCRKPPSHADTVCNTCLLGNPCAIKVGDVMGQKTAGVKSPEIPVTKRYFDSFPIPIKLLKNVCSVDHSMSIMPHNLGFFNSSIINGPITNIHSSEPL